MTSANRTTISSRRLRTPPPEPAAVQVLVGPTPIVNGAARASADITVCNGKLAFAIAVGTAVPYGVPRGAIIDVAPVSNGRIGRDHVVFADFIPNDWSAWPNTYHRVEILEQSAQRAVIRSTRDWGQTTVTTLYTLQDDSDAIEIRTTLHNEGSETLSDLLSGLTLWLNSGYLFGVPGLAGQRNGKAEGALSDRVVAYDADWRAAFRDAAGTSRSAFHWRRCRRWRLRARCASRSTVSTSTRSDATWVRCPMWSTCTTSTCGR